MVTELTDDKGHKTPDIRNTVSMSTRIYKPKDPEREGDYSYPLYVNRIDYGRLVDPAIPHLSTMEKVQRLDLFWLIDELQRRRSRQYENSVPCAGFFISKTHKDKQLLYILSLVIILI